MYVVCNICVHHANVSDVQLPPDAIVIIIIFYTAVIDVIVTLSCTDYVKVTVILSCTEYVDVIVNLSCTDNVNVTVTLSCTVCTMSTLL